MTDFVSFDQCKLIINEFTSYFENLVKFLLLLPWLLVLNISFLCEFTGECCLTLSVLFVSYVFG